MDVYCPICSEPWDVWEFTEYAADEQMTVDEVRSAFRKDGCSALGGRCAPLSAEVAADPRGLCTAIGLDLLGDDLDGLASTLDDFEFIGGFE